MVCLPLDEEMHYCYRYRNVLDWHRYIRKLRNRQRDIHRDLPRVRPIWWFPHYCWQRHEINSVKQRQWLPKLIQMQADIYEEIKQKNLHVSLVSYINRETKPINRRLKCSMWKYKACCFATMRSQISQMKCAEFESQKGLCKLPRSACDWGWTRANMNRNWLASGRFL